MQTLHEPAGPMPRTFHHSLDWRFLLPAASAGSLRVLAEEDPQLRLALEEVGISFCTPQTFPYPAEGEKTPVQAFALPLGLPVRWVDARSSDQVQFFRSIRQVIPTGGYIIIGFNNTWNRSKSQASLYHPCTPGRMAQLLEQAGFKAVRLFGALPNLSIPEYIFQVEEEAVHFALRHRFRRKRAFLKALQAVVKTVGMARVSSYLPSYFAIAVV